MAKLDTSPPQITLERVESVMINFKRDQDRLISFTWKDNPRTGLGPSGALSGQERLDIMTEQCRLFIDCVDKYKDVFASMDKLLSLLVFFGLDLSYEADEDPHGVAVHALQVLRRLPIYPVKLPDFDDIMEVSVRDVSGHPQQRLSSQYVNSWEGLDLVFQHTTTVIRMALAIASSRTREHGPPHIYQDQYPGYTKLVDDCLFHINELAELLEVASLLSVRSLNMCEKRKCLLLRSFLWSNWQRLVMLWMHFQLDKHLRARRYRHHEQYSLQVRATFPAPGITNEEYGAFPPYRDAYPKITYLCRWSFMLLRTQPALVTGDYRTFFDRYASLFAVRHQRCNPARAEALCDGVHPENCKRFIGMQVVDQSGHDGACNRKCCRLSWDERSFRSLSGARAVDIVATANGNGKLKYCAVSPSTVAISHAWIAGMGGRPERGMNACLHERFSAIVTQLGHASYWMDTPCIPWDLKLRKEAIQNIENVFDMSSAAVVCDRDIMSVDISSADFEVEDASDVTVKCCEQILAMMLICDWNVRAWTFLESFKGRNNIFVLCKDNLIISVTRYVSNLCL